MIGLPILPVHIFEQNRVYGLDKKGDEKNVLIFDLGGGTFDVSVLRLSSGVFQVLATGGDSSLGGDDIDLALAKWIFEKADLSDNIDPSLQRELLVAARTAKEKLSSCASVEINAAGWKGVLDKEKFEIVKDIDLSELCITSSAHVEKTEQNQVLVETEKA